MTEMLEKKLRDTAKRKGMTGDRADAFVLDMMSRRMGWTPEEKQKHQQEMKK